MIWKDVKGYEGVYMVSDEGQVKRLSSPRYQKEHIMSQSMVGYGYLRTILTRNGTSKNLYVHRIVAEAFCPNPNNYTEVNHIDEDKTNNCASNLEWCSRLYNVTYGKQKRKRHKVFQYTLSGELLAEYDGWADAEKKTGINYRRIFSAAHRHNGTSHGYLWRCE